MYMVASPQGFATPQQRQFQGPYYGLDIRNKAIRPIEAGTSPQCGQWDNMVLLHKQVVMYGDNSEDLRSATSIIPA